MFRNNIGTQSGRKSQKRGSLTQNLPTMSKYGSALPRVPAVRIFRSEGLAGSKVVTWQVCKGLDQLILGHVCFFMIDSLR